MKILLYDSGIGLVPFIKEIITSDIKNDYIFYMERECFPFGEKTKEELLSIFSKRLKEFESENIDILVVACNTISSLLKEIRFRPRYQIIDILSFNLMHYNSNSLLLGTLFLKEKLKDEYQIYGLKDLASSIEKNDIISIISDIKVLPKAQNYILCCTHYPLIESILRRYLKGNISSYHHELIATLPQGEKMSFRATKDTVKIILKYFPRMVINIL